MVMIEMREAMQDRAFELIDEMKDLGRQKKMVMCELEDTLYECFDGAKDEEKEGMSEEGMDLGYNGSYNRRYAMRNFNEEDYDYDGMGMRPYHRGMRSRRGMRMRRYA